MDVDRNRVCELYSAGPGGESSGSGYRIGDRLVLSARHVIAPAVTRPGGRTLVRAIGGGRWLTAAVEWQDAALDAALISVADDNLRLSAVDSVLRWGELAGSDPVPCATPRICTDAWRRSVS